MSLQGELHGSNKGTKHQFTVERCDNPKCRYTGEENYHRSGVCIHCGHGGIPTERVAMYFNGKRR